MDIERHRSNEGLRFEDHMFLENTAVPSATESVFEGLGSFPIRSDLKTTCSWITLLCRLQRRATLGNQQFQGVGITSYWIRLEDLRAGFCETLDEEFLDERDTESNSLCWKLASVVPSSVALSLFKQHEGIYSIAYFLISGEDGVTYTDARAWSARTFCDSEI